MNTTGSFFYIKVHEVYGDNRTLDEIMKVKTRDRKRKVSEKIFLFLLSITKEIFGYRCPCNTHFDCQNEDTWTDFTSNTESSASSYYIHNYCHQSDQRIFTTNSSRIMSIVVTTQVFFSL